MAHVDAGAGPRAVALHQPGLAKTRFGVGFFNVFYLVFKRKIKQIVFKPACLFLPSDPGSNLLYMRALRALHIHDSTPLAFWICIIPCAGVWVAIAATGAYIAARRLLVATCTRETVRRFLQQAARVMTC